jgi:hypothetical protein
MRAASGNRRLVPSAERRAHNEILFREANEQIRRVQKDLDLPHSTMPFLCECDEKTCLDIVRLTTVEYEEVRADGRHFAVAPGHDSATPIRRTERYDVVEKHGLEGEIVEAADPRDGG